MGFLKRSVKLRVTFWYAGFMLLILALEISLLFFLQKTETRKYYKQELTGISEYAEAHLAIDEDGTLHLTTTFAQGIFICVRDMEGNALVGKIYYGSEELKDGLLRVYADKKGVETGYALGRFITLSNGQEVWLRCYMSSTAMDIINQRSLRALALSIPFLLVIVLIGGYTLVKFGFKPICRLVTTAEKISSGEDLNEHLDYDGPDDEIGQLVHVLDGMLGRVKKSVETEKAFVSDASHELRTPISVIYAQSRYALNPGRTPEEKDAALEVIMKRSDLAGKMLSQMLLLTRMDNNRQTLDMEHINLSALVSSIADETKARAESRNTTLQPQIEPNIFITCDEMLMMRAIHNLISNSLHYGRENGHIQIRLVRDADTVRLSVIDDGPGIPKEHQEDVWHRFYQLNKCGKCGREGSGLGLPIVRQIVELHNGKITLESPPGCNFTIILPIDQKRSPE